jgi:uncharacterized protein YciI
MMPTFAYTIWPAREGMGPSNANPKEQAAVGEHWNYLVGLNEAGSVKFVGRSDSPPFIGICVFEAADQAAANELASGDPAVRAGVFGMRCQPYSIFFPA